MKIKAMRINDMMKQNARKRFKNASNKNSVTTTRLQENERGLCERGKCIYNYSHRKIKLMEVCGIKEVVGDKNYPTFIE